MAAGQDVPHSGGGLAPHGLRFAPDPSSQQACTVGGNVANNSGGPHCLAYGVTSAHVLAVEVVLPDGTVTVLGGLDPEPARPDPRGALLGSAGPPADSPPAPRPTIAAARPLRGAADACRSCVLISGTSIEVYLIREHS